MIYKEIAKTIIALRDKDLAYRDQLIREGRLGDGYDPIMADIHDENAEILHDIITAIGYPTVSKVGHDANEACWLIIQHAIGKPELMRNFEIQLQLAVDQGEANPIHHAYLSDRIAVLEGNPQGYGTQFDWDDQGIMNPQEVDDIELVNERRKSIGLNTLEEQIAIMRNRTKDENQLAHADLEKRKAEIQQWKKSVGWIS